MTTERKPGPDVYRAPPIQYIQPVRRCVECLSYCPDIGLGITDPQSPKTFAVAPVCAHCAPTVAADVVRQLRLSPDCTWSHGDNTRQVGAQEPVHVGDAVGETLCKAAFYRICVAALTEAENLTLSEAQKLDRVLEVLQEARCAKEV